MRSSAPLQQAGMTEGRGVYERSVGWQSDTAHAMEFGPTGTGMEWTAPSRAGQISTRNAMRECTLMWNSYDVRVHCIGS